MDLEIFKNPILGLVIVLLVELAERHDDLALEGHVLGAYVSIDD